MKSPLSRRVSGSSLLVLTIAATFASCVPGPAAAGDGAWSEMVAGARSGHSAILDPVRHRLLVFGGFDGAARNDVWELSLGGAPAWTKLAVLGEPPAAREQHSAVYDPVRDRMLVFGGLGASVDNRVWVLTLTGVPAWSALVPSGTSPGAVYGHAAVYDPVRDRMLVVGGSGGSGVWALTLGPNPAWSALNPGGVPPGARFNGSAIHDPVRDRLVLFGGTENGVYHNDAWALSLAGTPEWTALAPAGTPPVERASHGAIYDPLRDRMVVFGGSDYPTGALGDVWALSLDASPAWSLLTPTVTPLTSRWGHSATYDPAADRMLVFGGNDGSTCNDTWSLSLAGSPSWSPVLPQPGARAWHSAIVDAARSRMVVFGGTGSASFNDTWVLALGGIPSWTRLAPLGSPPTARFRHTAIDDPVRERMVVFGGYDGAYRNDVRALALSGTSVWTGVTASGTPPAVRFGHSAVYDPVRDRMLVFGGLGAALMDDVWALQFPGTPAWTHLLPTGTPPSAREAHDAIYDPVRDRMLVFGGYQDASPHACNDVWALSLSGTPAWSQLLPQGEPPPARYDASAVYDPVRDRLVMQGGSSEAAAHLGDGWALSLSGSPAWTPLSPGGMPPEARSGHTEVYDADRDRAVVFGGFNDLAGFGAELWACEWAPVTAVDPPALHPETSELQAPAPNPFAGSAMLRFTLAHAGRVRLGVYDVGGRLVRELVNGPRPAGAQVAEWNGKRASGGRLPAGMYFVRLEGAGIHASRRIVLM